MLWFYFYPNSKDKYNDFWHYLRMVGFVLSFTNSCLNPIALYFISGEFRKYFKLYLCSCERALMPPPHSTNSVFTPHSTTQEDPTRSTVAYLGSTNAYLNAPANQHRTQSMLHNQLSLSSSNNLSFSATKLPKFKCCSNWNSSTSYDDDTSDHAIEMMLNSNGTCLNNNHPQKKTNASTSSDPLRRKQLNSLSSR